MSYKFNYTPEFERQVKRLSKRHSSLKSDLEILIKSLKEDPQQGQPLGYNCYKIRFAITSKSKGKSGGGRLITNLIISKSEILFVTIYDKSEEESISLDEIKRIVVRYFKTS